VREWAATAQAGCGRRSDHDRRAHQHRLLLAILVVLVVIHEFGHFIVARRAGVIVHEFGIGFPPRAKVLGTRRRDDLHAQLAAARRLRPARRGGGRVGRPALVRPPAPGHPADILLAGVVMNFVLAFVIFAFIAGFSDPSRRHPRGRRPAQLAGRAGRAAGGSRSAPRPDGQTRSTTRAAT
jgi:membrane-associated protease RseP (regulator of RpoE activity)